MASHNGGAGTALALVSGGIDSPVAVARVLAMGWKVIPLHGSLEPIVGNEAEIKAVAALKHLRNPTGPLGEKGEGLVDHLHVAPVGETLSKFTEPQMHRDYFVHMKRLYNVMACILAKQVGATHIVTGENLGQVSSQTLGNLGAVERASELPILRPLLGFDKADIIHMARALGTLEISTGPEQCDALGPDHPTTVADLDRLLSNEDTLGGISDLAEACCAAVRRVEL